MEMFLRILQGVLTLSLLGLLVFYLIWGTPAIIEYPSSQGPSVPDNYLVNASNWQYGDDGYKSIELTVDSMQHYQDSGVSIINKPQLAVYEAGVAAWSVTAENGVMHNEVEHIRLSGDVRLLSLQNGPRLDTDAMDIYPQDKMAKSDSTVELRDGKSYLTAKSMEANLQRNHVTLRGNVRGSHIATK